MTQQHPITPPLELRQRWINVGRHQDLCNAYEYVADRAAQWGYNQAKADIKRERQEAADEELVKSLKWLMLNGHGDLYHKLRDARRPKPPNLKEEALLKLKELQALLQFENVDSSCIRHAIEQLPDPS